MHNRFILQLDSDNNHTLLQIGAFFTKLIPNQTDIKLCKFSAHFRFFITFSFLLLQLQFYSIDIVHIKFIYFIYNYSVFIAISRQIPNSFALILKFPWEID